MSRLEEIPVRVEVKPQRQPDIDIATGILQQVRAALKAFHESGRPQSIDLRHQPRISASSYHFLEESLGRGEVAATVHAELHAEIFETRYAGVWWVRHRDERGEITTEILEVTEVPALLKAHRVDMLGALRQLEQYLASPADEDGANSPVGCASSAATTRAASATPCGESPEGTQA